MKNRQKGTLYELEVQKILEGFLSAKVTKEKKERRKNEKEM